MKNKAAKQKSKKKGSDNVFGCDLTEHLQNSGQDVPQVLKTCAEFIEKHGIVDGIYRLSGVTSNIQRLRQEFCSESCPDLTKEVYLQDIHCVGSLCKLYFRELPNPLLTYELYKKFTDAVLVQGDDEKLLHIQSVIKELPVPHFRTLEFLTKHLAHLATLSPETNMHARNLALVWAPNLLRFKEIDVSTCSGDKAFQEVRVQQSVVEFILNHTEQIFNHGVLQTKPKEGQHLVCGDKYATLPISGQSGPMKLMSLEEAQARTLSPNHPARKERQRENSLPDTSTANLYHTVIDISDNKRKFSGKSKKWKSIFNLGKSVGDSKGKLSRNGSVFMRAHHSPEKAAMRPARSMDSLCSLPTDDDKAGNFNSAGGANGLLVPGMKSRTLGSDTLYDLSEQDQKWEFDRRNASGATGGCSPNVKRRVSPGASAPLHKALPEQLKVFKGEDISGCEPTSPKNRRMLYSGSSHNNASRPSFPGSIFPLESSPRHQRKALNISEPFAVSVPLRVSAVISVNSTPCRASGKDKTTAAALKPCKDATRSDLSDSSGGSGFRETTLGEGSWGSEFSDLNKSSSIQQLDDEERQDETEKRKEETIIKMVKEDLAGKDEVLLGEAEVTSIKPSFPNQKDTTLTPEADTVHTPGKHLDDEGMPPHKLTDAQLDKEPSPIDKELWFDVNQELKIIEPEIGILNEEFKLFFCATKNPCEGDRPKPDAQSKRRSSLPTCSLLYKGQTPVPSKSITTNVAATGKHSARKLPSESNTLSSFYRSFDFIPNAEIKYPISLSPDAKEKSKSKLPYNTEKGLQNIPQWQDKKPLPKENAKTGITDGIVDQVPCGVIARNVGEEADRILHRHSICMERKGITLESTHLDNEEGSGANYEELDMVEPWEDCCLSKQWVTSPLHSPTLKDLFGKLNTSQTSSVDLTVNCANTPLVPVSSKQINRTHSVKCPQPLAANSLQTCSGNTVTMGTNQQLFPTEMSMAKTDAAQPDQENISASKPRNTKSFQKFHRQMSHDTSCSEKREGNYFPKHRPFSLNLDLGHRCIRDISNQQHHQFSEVSSNQRELQSQVQTKHYRRSMELEMFLKDHQAPVRRNSAPVSVISVRTAFMIKTSQAKAVPVIPPKVQYSHIPHPKCDKVSDTLKGHEKDRTKTRSIESETGPPPQWNKDFKEELENKEPAAKSQKQQKAEETCETASILEIPVLRRKRLSNVDAYADCLRPDRPNVIQRPSFRNRQRPQSLILFSPPFPIMDYPSLGDDGKFLLSPIKCPTEVPALDVFSNKMADNLRTPEEVILRNKMTIPKIGQRLETSTSCFYQPQRRSMIFDNRSHRQIE